MTISIFDFGEDGIRTPEFFYPRRVDIVHFIDCTAEAKSIVGPCLPEMYHWLDQFPLPEKHGKLIRKGFLIDIIYGLNVQACCHINWTAANVRSFVFVVAWTVLWILTRRPVNPAVL